MLTNTVLQLLAIAIVTWLCLLLPTRPETRTAIVVIALLFALVVCLRFAFPGALGDL